LDGAGWRWWFAFDTVYDMSKFNRDVFGSNVRLNRAGQLFNVLEYRREEELISQNGKHKATLML
jgi:hypothetical protein